MTLWLAIPLILLLLVVLLFLLALASSIHFHFRVRRLGKDDRIEFDIRAVYGLVKFHYEVPALVFQSLEQGIKLKVEKTGIAPVKLDSEKEGQVDKESVTQWLKNVRTALHATRGLKNGLKTPCHIFRSPSWTGPQTSLWGGCNDRHGGGGLMGTEVDDDRRALPYGQTGA